MNYKIVENFLPKEDHDKIIDLFFGTQKLMQYVYSDYVGSPQDNSTFYFVNRMFPFRKGIDPNFFKLITPLLYHSNITTPFRVQVNCFIKQPQNILTTPHVDNPNPHNVFLYAVNTNNGYTILDPKGENIKIPSIANQALFFDGLIEHQAVTQTDENIRVNVNINYD